MKDLVLPVKQDSVISIAEITPKFKGLIIAYKDSNPIGYIQYYDDWGFYQDIDSENILTHDINLYVLLQELMEEFKITNFKVIDFIND